MHAGFQTGRRTLVGEPLITEFSFTSCKRNFSYVWTETASKAGRLCARLLTISLPDVSLKTTFKELT